MLENEHPFLILQLRPEPEAADSEYAAILQKAGLTPAQTHRLTPAQTHRIRLDVEPLPASLNLQSYGGIIVGGGPGLCVRRPVSQNPDRGEDRGGSAFPDAGGYRSRISRFSAAAMVSACLGHHLARAVSKARYAEPGCGTSPVQPHRGGQGGPTHQKTSPTILMPLSAIRRPCRPCLTAART